MIDINENLELPVDQIEGVYIPLLKRLGYRERVNLPWIKEIAPDKLRKHIVYRSVIFLRGGSSTNRREGLGNHDIIIALNIVNTEQGTIYDTIHLQVFLEKFNKYFRKYKTIERDYSYAMSQIAVPKNTKELNNIIKEIERYFKEIQISFTGKTSGGRKRI